MNYSDYGLDTTKLAKDEDKIGTSFCLWGTGGDFGGHNVKEGFSLCFASMVICHDCAQEATKVENQHRWLIGDCFKCGEKEKIVYSSKSDTPEWGMYICKDCIDWAKSILTKREKYLETKIIMTTEEILEQCKVEGTIVRLPDVELDYKTEYIPVKKRMELIGGKWKGGKINGFVFEQDPTDLLAEVAKGTQRNLKKEFQFFPTPADLVSHMISRCPAQFNTPGIKFLEPSAGDGAIAKIINLCNPDVKIDCFELMDLNRMRLEKLDFVNIVGDDFLKAVEENKCIEQYDVVIANPPFTKNQDIKHIRAMYKAVKPGGWVVTLSSRSWYIGSQSEQVAFRDWLNAMDAFIEEIEPGAFKESGTGVASTLIVFQRPALEKIEGVDYKISVSDETGMLKSEPMPDKQPEEILEEIESNVNSSLDILQSLKSNLLKNKPDNIEEMNFFNQLAALIGQAEVTLTVKGKNDTLTIMLMPKGSAEIKPLIVTGTPVELDEGFFALISPALKKTGELLSNVEEYEKNLNEAIVKTANKETGQDKPEKGKRGRGKAEKITEEPVETPDETVTKETDEPSAPVETEEEIQAREAAERKEKFQKLFERGEERFAEKNYTEALKYFESSIEFSDSVKEVSDRIAACTAEIERVDKFNTLIAKSAEFANAQDWKKAAGAMKQAKNFSLDPESLNEKIEEYIRKGLEAELAEQSEDYL